MAQLLRITNVLWKTNVDSNLPAVGGDQKICKFDDKRTQLQRGCNVLCIPRRQSFWEKDFPLNGRYEPDLLSIQCLLFPSTQQVHVYECCSATTSCHSTDNWSLAFLLWNFRKPHNRSSHKDSLVVFQSEIYFGSARLTRSAQN